jgi:hypothetical protein
VLPSNVSVEIARPLPTRGSTVSSSGFSTRICSKTVSLFPFSPRTLISIRYTPGRDGRLREPSNVPSQTAWW